MIKRRKVNKKLHAQLHSSEDRDKWMEAIKDAEVKIVEHKRKIRGLQCAIQDFKDLANAGEKWPKQKSV